MLNNESMNHPDKMLNQQGFPPGHMTAFYTLMSILLKMKHEQGLEVMLEYMSTFIAVIDSHNPQLAQAVAQTLQHTSSGEIYEQLGKYPKTKG
ncbi:MAG: hypothetical protein JNN05_09720 [Candidatus Omnitrophica bacterium]|nr:hypothetical protein [Candidatus Omnitrophota bacterium]